MAAPNEKELGLIQQFRKRVVDLDLPEDRMSDMYLVGWLRARDLNLDKANEMLRTSLKWRKAHDIETVLDWSPPVAYLTDYRWAILGEDKEGSPVGLIPFGVWDVRSAIEGGAKNTWLKYTDQLFAIVFKEMRDQSAAYGKPVTQFVLIFDFKGFTMRQLTSFGNVETVLEVIRRFEANYPESLRAAYIVNAPFIFSILFSLVKPLLTARTLSKVTIYGSNEAKWKKALLSTIEPDQLTVEYGGTRPAPKAQSTASRADPDARVESDGAEAGDLVSIHVPPGDKTELEYDIVHPNTELRWKFRTDHYDIGFSITFNDKAEVYPYQRHSSNTFLVEGTLNCERPGKYMLIFDNTYSKFRHKALHYMVTTSNPVDFSED